MNDEELKVIEERNERRDKRSVIHGEVCGNERCFVEDIRILLAEVKRLRHQLTLDENFRDPEFGGCVPSEK